MACCMQEVWKIIPTQHTTYRKYYDLLRPNKEMGGSTMTNQIPTPTVLEYIAWLESNLTKWVWNVTTDDEVENKFKTYIGRIGHAGSGFFYLKEEEE